MIFEKLGRESDDLKAVEVISTCEDCGDYVMFKKIV